MKKSLLLLALLTISISVGCGTRDPQTPPRESAPKTLADKEPSSNPSQAQQGDRSAGDLRSDDEVVQQEVRKMATAVYQSDVDTVLSYTHPKIIDLMGGTKQARSTLETAFSQFESLNMELESITFPEAPTFLNTDSNRFVIVPTKSIISADGQRFESLNYQFGIQRHGTTSWSYVEGSRINKQSVRSLFPDFPPDYEFPEFYRKKL